MNYAYCMTVSGSPLLKSIEYNKLFQRYPKPEKTAHASPPLPKPIIPIFPPTTSTHSHLSPLPRHITTLPAQTTLPDPSIKFTLSLSRCHTSLPARGAGLSLVHFFLSTGGCKHNEARRNQHASGDRQLLSTAQKNLHLTGERKTQRGNEKTSCQDNLRQRGGGMFILGAGRGKGQGYYAGNLIHG